MSMETSNAWFKDVREFADLIEAITCHPVTLRQTLKQKKAGKCSLFGPKRFCWFTFQKTKRKQLRWVTKEEWVDLDLLERAPEYRGSYFRHPTVGWFTEPSEQQRDQIARILAKACEVCHR
jgi:hypothetical protein